MLLTLSEVATELQVSKRTVRRMMERGELQVIMLGIGRKGLPRIHPDDLKDFIERQRKKAKKQWQSQKTLKPVDGNHGSVTHLVNNNSSHRQNISRRVSRNVTPKK